MLDLADKIGTALNAFGDGVLSYEEALDSILRAISEEIDPGVEVDPEELY